MQNTWHNKISQWFFQQDHDQLDWHLKLVVDASLLLVAFLVAAAAYFVVRKIVFGTVTKVIQKTEASWDDELLNSRIFKWLSLLIPAVIILNAAPHAIITHHDGVPVFRSFIEISAKIGIIIFSFLAVNSLLNVLERIYGTFEVSKELPIKSFFQVIKIILVLAALIYIISTLIGKSPVLIFSGLGAMTAILTTVKIRNWDKTITTIPTYALISDSFKNWRGMSSSGVRRIKRSVSLDMSTVAFLDEESLPRLRKISLLKDYLANKEEGIEKWNAENADPSNPLNARSLTNLGTFRAYIREYLKTHPKIAQNETLLVRQLQPTENGIPIELYIFTTDNRWAYYEDIQSDIFDHFLSVLPEFGLRAFQAPSDHSFLPHR